MKSSDSVVIITALEKRKEYEVDTGESKTFVIFLCDGISAEGDIIIRMVGENSHAQILGVILGYQEQKIKLYTYQNHQKRESVSDLLIKSILFDKAQFHYEGLIKIEKNAQRSNAYQKNQNLLLSSAAWAHSKPALEILANDVRCTHGATIGQISSEELYYLQTRGISRSDATALIVEGFCQDVLMRIPDRKIMDKLTDQLHSKVIELLQ